ncbi:uncharacterized protein IUM83_17434 [Phytophthora cinnamomi]|uniref:uncharacterized protein n=1 Tax=Phytophthora cinnamomi TaxID=4785 RepID=UPI00355A1AB0|nr:hypothetical protein IUM83_17434 [Phytophthora cinnamomi]
MGSDKTTAAEHLSRKPTDADKLFKKFKFVHVSADLLANQQQFVKWNIIIQAQFRLAGLGWGRISSTRDFVRSRGKQFP